MSDPIENVLPAGSDTILQISFLGQMLYQARGLSQTLEVIGAATQLERMADGSLADFSAAQFRKYQSKVTIPSEVNPSPLDGIWPGMEVTVHCAVALGFVTGTVGSPVRPEVSGSSWSEGAYTFYRPLLQMRVRTVETHFDEWKNIVGWSMDLEEI